MENCFIISTEVKKGIPLNSIKSFGTVLVRVLQRNRTRLPLGVERQLPLVKKAPEIRGSMSPASLGSSHTSHYNFQDRSPWQGKVLCPVLRTIFYEPPAPILCLARESCTTVFSSVSIKPSLNLAFLNFDVSGKRWQTSGERCFISQCSLIATTDTFWKAWRNLGFVQEALHLCPAKRVGDGIGLLCLNFKGLASLQQVADTFLRPKL